ncbi:hypothetical protein V8V91_04665 [Algoriphagus halophilus]|uniref:hypothetical protein n=1 Tax=Algoriphagus halophilus TaxID=226505 RepID=UPI00358F0A66
MNEIFSHIASVTFFHSYFPTSGFTGFELSYSNRTAKILTNYSMLLKNSPAGFHLLCSDLEVLKNERRNLNFHLSIKDPKFLNYTDLDRFRLGHEVLFLSNFLDKPNQETLQKGEKVTSEDIFPIVDFPKLKNQLVGFSGKITLVDSFKNVVFEYEHVDHIPEDLEEGLYEFKSNGKAISCYYLNEGSFRVPHIIVSLNLGLIYQDFVTNGTKEFHADFQSRSTVWRYILAEKFYEKFADLTILDLNSKELLFSKSEVQVSPTLTFSCLQSDISIPLSSEEEYRFQLIDQYNPEKNRKNCD